MRPHEHELDYAISHLAFELQQAQRELDKNKQNYDIADANLKQSTEAVRGFKTAIAALTAITERERLKP